MFKIFALLAPLALLNSCAADESISGYADTGAEYELVEIDGVAFAGRATISFPEAGEVVGQAPCNRYFGAQSEPYPWFNVDGIGATRMACPDLELEIAFLAALQAMTLSEVSGNTLILSNTQGRQMVFVAP